MESELLAQSEIGQAMVFGEARAELGALIVPLTASLTHVDLEQAVARANQNLPDYAQVRHWQVREPFNAAAGELTGNGRLKRSVVLARCQSLIEALD